MRWLTGIFLAVFAVSASAADRQGSGFFINMRGDLMTARHVVEGCPLIWVNNPYMSRTRATMQVSYGMNDSSVLTIKSTPPGYLSFSTKKNLHTTSEWLFGFGYVGDLLRVVAGYHKSGSVQDLDRFTGDIAQGMSGGALVTGSGNVFGLVAARLDRSKVQKSTGVLVPPEGYYVPWFQLMVLLGAAKIAYHEAPETGELAPASLRKKVDRAVVEVICEE